MDLQGWQRELALGLEFEQETAGGKIFDSSALIAPLPQFAQLPGQVFAAPLPMGLDPAT